MQRYHQLSGIPGATVKLTASDNAQSLAGLITTTMTGKTLSGALITVEDHKVRFTMGGATATANLGHILYPGGSIQLGSALMGDRK